MAIHSLNTVTVTTAGTRVRATVNQADPTRRIVCQSFLVQADPANTGIGSVGGNAVVYSTGTDVWGYIGVPTTTVIPAFASRYSGAPGPFNLADVYLDASVNGQKFIISYVS